jgi:hypothetical protein
MSSAAFEKILEEAKVLPPEFLPPEERLRLRGQLGDEKESGALGFLFAAGLVHLILKINNPPPDEQRRLNGLLMRLAVELGVISRADFLREIRGKYAHLQTSSEEFAAQKQHEIELENRRR